MYINLYGMFRLGGERENISTPKIIWDLKLQNATKTKQNVYSEIS